MILERRLHVHDFDIEWLSHSLREPCGCLLAGTAKFSAHGGAHPRWCDVVRGLGENPPRRLLQRTPRAQVKYYLAFEISIALS